MNPGGERLKSLLNIHCGSSHHLHSMVNYMDHTFMYLNEINNIITSLPMYVRVHVWVFIAEQNAEARMQRPWIRIPLKPEINSFLA